MSLLSNPLTDLVGTIPESKDESSITIGVPGAKDKIYLTPFNTTAGGNLSTRNTVGSQALLIASLLKETFDNEEDYKKIIQKSIINVKGQDYPLRKALSAAADSEAVMNSKVENSIRGYINAAAKKNPAIDKFDSLEGFKKSWAGFAKMGGMEATLLQLNNPEYVEKIGNYLKEPSNLIVFSEDAKTCSNFMGGAGVMVIGKEVAESPQSAVAYMYHLDFLEKKVFTPQLADKLKDKALGVELNLLGLSVVSTVPALRVLNEQVKGRGMDEKSIISRKEFEALDGAVKTVQNIASDEEHAVALQKLFTGVGASMIQKPVAEIEAEVDYSPGM
jgi:hypothetical protein